MLDLFCYDCKLKHIVMKKIVIITLLLTPFVLSAQVGIGTTNPQASLDISSSNIATPSNTDGILIPRMDEFPATDPALAQDGMMVFVTGGGTPSKGFYYWDHTAMSWVAIINTGGATLDGAYDFGGAGAGNTIMATDGAVEINGEDGMVITGIFGSGNTIDTEVTGAGTRMFFNPNKSAFRSGTVMGTQWDDTNIGAYSTAFGQDNIASGNNSTSIGYNNQARSYGEIALGFFNTGNTPNSTTAFDADDRLLIVGNGTSNGARSDAFTILKNGYVGINTSVPSNPLEIDIITTFDLLHTNSGQDGIFIVGKGDNSGLNSIGGSISFGPSHTTRGGQRKSAIASVQTSGDIDHTGLAFYVHGNAINQSPMVEAMRLTHNRQLGINNVSPSANLDVIGTLQYEDGNESLGYVLASDATGNATWTDPNGLVSFVDEIDELLDGKSDSDGTNNGSSIFLGINAGAADDSDDNRNIGIGYLALEDNTTGSQNTAVGYHALLNNIDGTANTAIGSGSLDANTDGIWNTAIGQAALSGNIDGAYNTAVGRAALLVNSDGNSNVAIGVNAISSNSSGSFNTVIGVDAATGLDASSNTIIGRRAMNSYSAGGNNVAIGASAGYYGSGTENTYLGTSAGFTPGAPARDGSVFLGYGAGSSEITSDKLYIENSSGDATVALIYGEFDNDILRFNGDVGIGRAPVTNALEVEGDASKTTAGAFVANSDRRLKKNIQTLGGKTALEKIQSLRGVTYLWNDTKTGSKRPEGIQYGFIAQEIQEVFPEKVSEDNLGYLQTAYGDYDALFVQAIKEQQLQIEALSEEIYQLKIALSKVDVLEARLSAMEANNKSTTKNALLISDKK